MRPRNKISFRKRSRGMDAGTFRLGMMMRGFYYKTMVNQFFGSVVAGVVFCFVEEVLRGAFADEHPDKPRSHCVVSDRMFYHFVGAKKGDLRAAREVLRKFPFLYVTRINGKRSKTHFELDWREYEDELRRFHLAYPYDPKTQDSLPARKRGTK